MRSRRIWCPSQLNPFCTSFERNCSHFCCALSKSPFLNSEVPIVFSSSAIFLATAGSCTSASSSSHRIRVSSKSTSRYVDLVHAWRVTFVTVPKLVCLSLLLNNFFVTHHSTIRYDNFLFGFVVFDWWIFHESHCRLSAQHSSENDVFTIKMRCWDGSNEELGSVCTLSIVLVQYVLHHEKVKIAKTYGASIRHWEQKRTVMSIIQIRHETPQPVQFVLYLL